MEAAELTEESTDAAAKSVEESTDDVAAETAQEWADAATETAEEWADEATEMDSCCVVRRPCLHHVDLEVVNCDLEEMMVAPHLGSALL